MSDEKPTLRQSLRNFWGSDVPFAKRVRLSVRNNWIKATKRQNCCGHQGEPGCCISSQKHAHP